MTDQPPADAAAIDQIRKAHESANPKPSNPSWKNCHRDCGALLAAVEALRERVTELEGALGKITPILTRATMSGQLRRGHDEITRLVEVVLAPPLDKETP